VRWSWDVRTAKRPKTPRKKKVFRAVCNLTRSLGNHPELVEGWFDRLTMKPLSLPKGDKLTMIA
jgi:hypothetical protein